jgi:inorganic pyrophosphatase-like protein
MPSMRCVLLAKGVDYRTRVYGLPVVVETRRGRVRRGKEPDGTPWATKMEVPYGYFPGVRGLDDGDLDVFVGDDKDATDVYLVTTMKYPDYTEPDEVKVFARFPSESAVRRCFNRHYDRPQALGYVRHLSVEQFQCMMQECRDAGATIAP